MGRTRILEWTLIICLLSLAVFLRFYGLSSNPAGFFPDEASTAYDARCLLENGQDQHGNSWPFFFLSYADDLSGTYRYLTLATFFIAGDELWKARIPAALSSLLITVILGLFTRDWWSRPVTLAVLLMTAVSPWLMPYSRTGQRIILLPLVMTVWVILWDRYCENPSNNRLIVASLVLSFSLYTYVAARVIFPAMAVFVLITLFIRKEHVLLRISLALACFSLGALPMAIHALDTPELFFMRFQQVSIFKQNGFSVGSLIVLKNYVSHWLPDFLFIHGDANIRHSQLRFGQIYWVQGPLIIMGLVYLWRTHTRRLWSLLILCLVAPLPAALSADGNPHALRSITLVIPLILLSGAGLQMVMSSSRRFHLIIGYGAMFILVIESSWCAYDFMVRYPVYSAKSWEYGTRQAVQICTTDLKDYDEYWFTSRAIGADRIIAYEVRIPCAQFATHQLTQSKFRWHWSIPIERVFQNHVQARRLFIIRKDELIDQPDVYPPICYPDGDVAFRFVSKTP